MVYGSKDGRLWLRIVGNARNENLAFVTRKFQEGAAWLPLYRDGMMIDLSECGFAFSAIIKWFMEFGSAHPPGRIEWRGAKNSMWQATSLKMLVQLAGAELTLLSKDEIEEAKTALMLDKPLSLEVAQARKAPPRKHTGGWSCHDDDCRCMCATSGYCNRNGYVWDCCGSVVEQSSCAGPNGEHHTAVSHRSDALKCACDECKGL